MAMPSLAGPSVRDLMTLGADPHPTRTHGAQAGAIQVGYSESGWTPSGTSRAPEERSLEQAIPSPEGH